MVDLVEKVIYRITTPTRQSWGATRQEDNEK